MYKNLIISMTLNLFLTNACVPPAPLTLQLILEYAKWRSWDQVVIFDDIYPIDCAMRYIKPLIKCYEKIGISMTVQPIENPNIPDVLAIHKHRVGSIVLLDALNLTSTENVLQMASQKLLFNYYISWLLITAKKTDTIIDTVLRDLNIGIDSDVVVATSPLSKNTTINLVEEYLNKTCSRIQSYARSFVFQDEGRKHVASNSTINLHFVKQANESVVFYLIHVFKIRTNDNSSLVTDFLGSWSPGSYSMRGPISVKLRDNFHKLPIIFGVLNGSNDGQTNGNEQIDGNDIEPLLDFGRFFTAGLNASMELVPYEKLGTVTNKVWNNLLGDVVSGTVDIGLGYITINEERIDEMAFTHPLIRYMRNIYYHPLDIGTMRDIFLQPFNNKLLACVAVTYVFILIAMGFIIYATKTLTHHGEDQISNLGEAALWCISIMCMQGSPWVPKSPSGKTLLFFSLIFALVTYSAYAGFITSILSVQTSGIKSIKDLITNNFILGYSVTDDEYIRNVNDSHLRNLYIKAFNNRESRLDTISGLKKAVKGRYGFFVSATLARRCLKASLIQERCSLKELPLPQTFTVVALPMANTCPYRRIINLSILRIQERGVLDKIAERMLPAMPMCKQTTTFNSARLADVYSAFIILILGIVTAFTLGVSERLWHGRKRMQDKIIRGMKSHGLHLNHDNNRLHNSLNHRFDTRAPGNGQDFPRRDHVSHFNYYERNDRSWIDRNGSNVHRDTFQHDNVAINKKSKIESSQSNYNVGFGSFRKKTNKNSLVQFDKIDDKTKNLIPYQY